MRLGKIALFIGIFNLLYICQLSAQRMDRGLDFNFLLGVNIGATTPVPVPKELDIKRYNPKLNPKAGANLTFFFNEHWGVGAGLTLDWKGMNVHTEVSDVHLSIDVPNLGTLTGYVTGRNKTRVNAVYLTQPIYGMYRINHKWQVKGGIYLAETLSRKFKGRVTDVDIVVESPLAVERQIPYATLDYHDDTRKFDMGLLLGGEFMLNANVGFFADFTWAFTPYFSKEVPIHFTMRNVYLSLGATFRLNKANRNIY